MADSWAIFSKACLALLIGAAIAVAAGPLAEAQESVTQSDNNMPAPSSPGQEPNIPEIIRRFAEKETEFQRARENYTYRQIVKVQELSDEDRVLGTFEQTSDIIFTPDGKRTEKVVRAPLATLSRVSISPEDERDLRDIQPFVLTTKDIPKYNIQYKGRERVDELDTFVFQVGPKTMQKGERYFEGQIWVDDRDFQIVKSYGKAVPDIRGKKGDENLFPRFSTYREQIDGKYWFPTWTGAEDTLHFSTGDQKIRMLVRYENYKQFRTDVKVTYGDEVPAQEPKP